MSNLASLLGNKVLTAFISQAAINTCALMALSCMVPPRRPRWLYPLLALLLTALFTIFHSYDQLHNLVYIGLILPIVHHRHGLPWAKALTAACVSIFLVLAVSLLLHSILTFAIPGFQARPWREYAIAALNLVLFSAAKLVLHTKRIRVKLHKLPGSSGLLLVLALGVYLSFYSLVLRRFHTTDYATLAGLNIMVLVQIAILATLLYHIYRQHKQALDANNQRTTLLEQEKTIETAALLAHSYGQHYASLIPPLQKGDAAEALQYLHANITPVHALHKQDELALNQITDTRLRYLLQSKIAAYRAARPWKLYLDAKGEIAIPPHLSQSVYTITLNLLDNAARQLDEGGGALYINLGGSPGIASIEVANTVPPGFTLRRLQGTARPAAKGNGLRLVNSEVAVHPQELHLYTTLPLTPKGQTYKLSMELSILTQREPL